MAISCERNASMKARLFPSGRKPTRFRQNVRIAADFLRPDVVWFEEAMPEQETALAFEVSARCDLFFAIGTSAVVFPAASLPSEALNAGATVVEINPEPTPLSAKADFVLTGPAGTVLPQL